MPTCRPLGAGLFEVRSSLKSNKIARVLFATTKGEMAKRLETSRAQLDRILDPKNTGVTLDALSRAATALGEKLRLELV